MATRERDVGGNVKDGGGSHTAELWLFWLFGLPTIISVSISYPNADPGQFLVRWLSCEAVIVVITLIVYSPRWTRHFKHKHDFVTIRKQYKLCRGCGELQNEQGVSVRKLEKVDKEKLLEIYRSDLSRRISRYQAEEKRKYEKLLEELGVPKPINTENNVSKKGRQNGRPLDLRNEEKEAVPVHEGILSNAVGVSPASREDYEVVLSFAGEDREYVEKVAEYLKRNNIGVFYDRYEEVSLWGKELTEFLDKVYRGSARYCVMFISKHYANKIWTTHERRSALAKAVQEKEEYILPARFDDTELPGLRPTIGYVDLRKKTPEELGKMVLQKLGKLKR
nr:TIR domain-containing protein [Candidatus Njordarchaeota archaeon]